MPSIELDGTTVPYTVRQSSRAQHVSMRYRLDGLEIVVPEDHPFSRQQARSALQDHADHLLERHHEVQRMRAEIPERPCTDGSQLAVFGTRRTVIHGDTPGVDPDTIRLRDDKVQQHGPKDAAEDLLREHVRGQVRSIIKDHDGPTPETIYIRDQSTKWGSCSGKDNISVNWRLAFAPEDVFRYVVVHELVHLEELNHSTAFYDRLEQRVPDWQDHQDWLDEEGHRLRFRPP